MGRAARRKDRPVDAGGAREPCPCGSGRRYRACHGSPRAAQPYVTRPFAGLAGECDWVAMREIVPAATAPLRLAGSSDRSVTLATLLPLGWAAAVRPDGEILLGLQGADGGGDLSRVLAAALQLGLAADAGSAVAAADALAVAGSGPATAPRLQDLLDPSAPLEVSVHAGFDFWVASGKTGATGADPEVLAALERADAAAVPTARLPGLGAAYWCALRERNHLRWVLPYDEEPLLDALARLHLAGADDVGEGSRYVGSFRAHGLLLPVWDLPAGTPAEAVAGPAAAYAQRLGDALAVDRPLSIEERRARAGLLHRQLTLR